MQTDVVVNFNQFKLVVVKAVAKRELVAKALLKTTKNKVKTFKIKKVATKNATFFFIYYSEQTLLIGIYL